MKRVLKIMRKTSLFPRQFFVFFFLTWIISQVLLEYKLPWLRRDELYLISIYILSVFTFLFMRKFILIDAFFPLLWNQNTPHTFSLSCKYWSRISQCLVRQTSVNCRIGSITSCDQQITWQTSRKCKSK